MFLMNNAALFILYYMTSYCCFNTDAVVLNLKDEINQECRSWLSGLLRYSYQITESVPLSHHIYFEIIRGMQ